MKELYRKRIGELYSAMHDKLFVYARIALGSESLAEEAIQETFGIACQKPEKLCGSPNPEGWLFITLKNTIRNMKRCRSSAKQIIDLYFLDQAKDYAIHEDTISLNVQYGNLANSEEFKLLFELAVEGRSHAEMAQARGISVSACKKRVQRAKEMLRKKLDF